MTGVRVLIVDDAPEVRRLVQDVLEDEPGWRVVATASDGERGIELATAEQPDLVVLDLAMPVMDGLEALPHIRAAAPEAVVVILTGYPSEVAAASAQASGAQGFIEKQNMVTDLLPQLAAILADVHSKVAG